MFVPYHRPPEIDYEPMLDAFRAGHASAGPEVQEFEDAMLEWYDVEGLRAIAVGSCSVALRICVAYASTLEEGLMFNVPDLTWNATLNAVIENREFATVVSTDERGILDPSDVYEHTHNVSLPVMLYGNPITQHALDELKRRSDHVIVDCAQDLENAASYEGTLASCISFHALKSMPLGSGGMILTKDPALEEFARAARSHGTVRVNGSRVQHQWGTKGEMTAPHAALGKSLIPRLDSWVSIRRELCATYADECKEAGLEYVEHADSSSCHMFIVLPDSIRSFQMHCEGHIGISHMYPPLAMGDHIWSNEFITLSERAKYSLPNHMGHRALSIPMRSSLTVSEVDKVCEMIRSYEG